MEMTADFYKKVDSLVFNRRRVMERFQIRRTYKTWYPHATMRKNSNGCLIKVGQSRRHMTRLQKGDEFVALVRALPFSLDSNMGAGRRGDRRSEKKPEPYEKVTEARCGGACLK